MPIRIQCFHCQTVVSVADHLRGRMIRCPYCQEPTKVPGGPPRAQPGRAAPTQMRRAPYQPYEEPMPPPRRKPAPRPAPQPQYEEDFDDAIVEEPPPRARPRPPEPEYDDDPPPQKPQRRAPEPEPEEFYDDEPPEPIRRGQGRARKGEGGGGFMKVVLTLFILAALGGGGFAFYYFYPDFFHNLFQAAAAPPPAYVRYLPGNANGIVGVNLSGSNNALLKKWAKDFAEVLPDFDHASLDKILEATDSIVVGGEFKEKQHQAVVSLVITTSSAVDVDVIKKAFHLGDKDSHGSKAYRVKEPAATAKGKDGKDKKDKLDTLRPHQYVYIDDKTIVLFQGSEAQLGSMLDKKTPLGNDTLAQIKKLDKNAIWAVATVDSTLKDQIKKQLDDGKKMRAGPAKSLEEVTKQHEDLTKAIEKGAATDEALAALTAQKTAIEMQLKLMDDGIDLAQAAHDAKFYTFQANFDSGALKFEIGLECDAEASAKKAAAALDHERDKRLGMLTDLVGGKESDLGKSLAEFAGSIKVSSEGARFSVSAAVSDGLIKQADALIAEKKKEFKEVQAKLKEKQEFLAKEFQEKQIAVDLGDGVVLELVRIEPGKFKMGSPKDENRGDVEFQHEVQITRPFFMGKFEVTQKQFGQILGEQKLKGYSEYHPDGQDTSNFPMDKTSMKATREFLEALSKKTGRKFDLPTEAEWEYACRAGTTTPYSFGKELTDEQARFGKSGNEDKPAPVGSFPPNAWGLYDMHGNVAEWCKDLYSKDYYKKSPKADPPGPAKNENGGMVVRGGCWRDDVGNCRSASRRDYAPNTAAVSVGFRVVMRGP